MIKNQMMKLARLARHSKIGMRLLPDQRVRLAAAHLRGNGMEIGALYKPLPVSSECTVKYVDRATREELIAAFPELNPNEIIVPDIIDDGFTLKTIGADSQDFIIANHVLEHSPDPIGALRQWSRVVRPDGLLFITVPLAARCFDRGREITTLEHLIADERLYRQGEAGALRERNRKHYDEWVRISLPGIRAQTRGISSPQGKSIEQQVESLLDALEEIHFHTFSHESFGELLSYLETTFEPNLATVDYLRGRSEMSAVLRKRLSPMQVPNREPRN